VARAGPADRQGAPRRVVELMTEEQIIERLRDGSIPRWMPGPPTGRPEGRETIIINGGLGQRCSACDEVIGAAVRGSIVYIYGDREIRFHGTCHALWQRERHTPLRRILVVDDEPRILYLLTVGWVPKPVNLMYKRPLSVGSGERDALGFILALRTARTRGLSSEGERFELANGTRKRCAVLAVALLDRQRRRRPPEDGRSDLRREKRGLHRGSRRRTIQ
jgi:hypothetical protein